MAEDSTRLHLVGRDQPLVVEGSLADVQSSLAAGAGNMVQLNLDADGSSVIINPTHVTHLEASHTSVYESRGAAFV